MPKAFTYDYIKNAYGVEFVQGQRVVHTVTGDHGVVSPAEVPGGTHYVRVKFGRREAVNCHPRELETERD